MQAKYFLSRLKPFAKIFDVIFASVIVGPLVVIYWISVWNLSDIFITPDDPIQSALISFVIGFSGQFVVLYFQDEISKWFKFKNMIFNVIASRSYAMFSAVTCISLWRGLWKFADFISTTNTMFTVLNVVQNLTILMVSRTIKNSIAGPFIVSTDQSNCDYKVSTFFSKVVS